MFEHEDVTVRKPRAWLVRAMTTLFVSGIVAVALGVIWWSSWVFPGMLAMLFAASTLGYVPRIGVGATCRVGRVTAGASGLVLDGTMLMLRESIAAGYSPSPGSRTVHVIGRGFFERLEVRLPHGADAQRLIDALALEPSQRTALFRVEGMWGRLLRENLWFLGQVACFNVTRLSGQALALIASMASFLYAMLLIPRRLVVGHDGISIAYLGAERFLPYVSIFSVQRLGTQVIIDTAEGKMRFQIYGTMREVDDAEALASMMDRARERAAHARLAAEKVLAEMFSRGARTNEAWLADLRRLLQEGRGSYRNPAIEPERLWKLVEDAVSDETARAGAAWTLASHPTLEHSSMAERFARLAERSASALMCELAEAASGRDARRLGEILLRWPDAGGFPTEPRLRVEIDEIKARVSTSTSISIPIHEVCEMDDGGADFDEELCDESVDDEPFGKRRRLVPRARSSTTG